MGSGGGWRGVRGTDTDRGELELGSRGLAWVGRELGVGGCPLRARGVPVRGSVRGVPVGIVDVLVGVHRGLSEDVPRVDEGGRKPFGSGGEFASPRPHPTAGRPYFRDAYPPGEGVGGVGGIAGRWTGGWGLPVRSRRRSNSRRESGGGPLRTDLPGLAGPLNLFSSGVGLSRTGRHGPESKSTDHDSWVGVTRSWFTHHPSPATDVRSRSSYDPVGVSGSYPVVDLPSPPSTLTILTPTRSSVAQGCSPTWVTSGRPV